ncbi:MAG: hypothetical protein IJM68_01005 [Synergistaceae bacterium]|nr:hypothetical protein [Synergistaceae bacterium]
MAEETRPCPFCGGKAYIYDIWKCGKKVWKVMCGARVDCCAILNDFDTQDEAVAVWNGERVKKHE